MYVLSNPRFRLSALILWCLCWPGIALLLLTPLPFQLISRTDLLGHFLLFCAMTLAVITFARSNRQIVLLSLMTVGYGVALEFGQGYVPNRFFDVADAIANVAGGLAGCVAAIVLLKVWINPVIAATKNQSDNLRQQNRCSPAS